MIRAHFIFGLIFVVVSSCQKQNQFFAEEFYPLSVGNHWVYETHRVDSADNDIAYLYTDSICIVSDTIVGTDQFFKQRLYRKGTGSPSYTLMYSAFIRYNNHNVETLDGDLWFSLFQTRNHNLYISADSTHYIETLSNVPDPYANIQVYAAVGTFPSIEEVDSYIEYDSSAVNPITLTTHSFYSSRVGLLLKESYTVSTLLYPNNPNTFRALQRLKKYQMN